MAEGPAPTVLICRGLVKIPTACTIKCMNYHASAGASAANITGYRSLELSHGTEVTCLSELWYSTIEYSEDTNLAKNIYIHSTLGVRSDNT